MVAQAFESNLPVGLTSISDDATMDPFIDVINATAALGADTLSPLAYQAASVIARVQAGTVNFGHGFPNMSGVGGMDLIFGLPFGFEAAELLAWYWEGGGRAVQIAQLVDAGLDKIVPFIFAITGAQAGGWWKEPISQRILDSGKYSNGTQIKLRLFGIGQTIMNKVFPNVETPAATGGVAALDDWKDGVFNALEYAHPEPDSTDLFPNWPDVAESIIAAGATDYYLSGWWQPQACIEVWINKDYYDALTADQKTSIEAASKSSALTNLAISKSDQGAIVKAFQDMGVTVHDQWPHDVLERIRNATAEVIDNRTEGGTPDSIRQKAIVDSFKAFAKAEQVWWNRSNAKRASRFKWAGWESNTVV